MKTKYWVDGAADFEIVDGQLTARQVEYVVGLPAGSVVDTEWHHVNEPAEPDHQA